MREYEEKIIRFLSNRENLPLVLEIVDRYESIECKLYEQFWRIIKENLEKNIQSVGMSNLWECNLPKDEKPNKNKYRCKVVEKNGENSEILCYIIEIEYIEDKCEITHGIYSEITDIREPKWQEKEECRKLLLEAKKIHGRSMQYYPGWKYSYDKNLLKNEMLLSINENPDEIAGEVAEAAWHDFKRIEEYIRKANKEINEVLEEIRKYNNTIRK